MFELNNSKKQRVIDIASCLNCLSSAEFLGVNDEASCLKCLSLAEFRGGVTA